LPVRERVRALAAPRSALLVLLLSGCGGSAGHVERGGPLACGSCQGDGSMPMRVGELGTWDAATLQNKGKAPAVLERVVYLHRTPGVLLLGPLVARKSSLGLIREFPPRHFVGKLDLLPGYAVPPYHRLEDQVDILVGVSPLQNGRLSYNGLDVYYRVAKKHYVAFFDEGLRVCAPRSVPQDRCRPPPSIK
jgi:hypothetical protein